MLGMMPAGLPMPSLPSLGGGGLPGLGGSDPLSASSGLGGAGARGHDPSFEDGSGHPDSGTPKLRDARNSGDGGGTGSDKGSDAGDRNLQVSMARRVRSWPVTTACIQVMGQALARPGARTWPCRMGWTAQARTAQGATAARAALHGATVADAWHQAGVTVPPPGTPVTAPIPPTQLKAGDVGVWKDHLVMALGNSKVLVSGQVQPLSSVGSGPDFLGWMDPSAAGGPGGQGAAYGAPAGPPPPATPPGQQS